MKAVFDLTALPSGDQKPVKRFLKDTSGAVTVDWVVLTAAIVGIGVAVLTSVSGGTTTLASTVSSEISGMEVLSSSGDWTDLAPENGILDCQVDVCQVIPYGGEDMQNVPNTTGKTNFYSEFEDGEMVDYYDYS
ncbi:MAG: hypothetical protein VX874_04980 [Pseudomonadota bacterium]|nr:hypothetical protein [Pseudomonadota bacterium]